MNQFFYFMCTCVLHACKYVHQMCTVTTEARRRCQMSENWSSWFWAIMWILETTSRSSIIAASTCNFWAMSPVMFFFFLYSIWWCIFGYPGTYYVAQASLKFTMITPLPQPPLSEYRKLSHYAKSFLMGSFLRNKKQSWYTLNIKLPQFVQASRPFYVYVCCLEIINTRNDKQKYL